VVTGTSSVTVATAKLVTVMVVEVGIMTTLVLVTGQEVVVVVVTMVVL
jgi:hypothetical protein